MGKLGIVVILLLLEQVSAIAGGKTIMAVVGTITQFVSMSNFTDSSSHISEQKRGPEGGDFERAC